MTTPDPETTETIDGQIDDDIILDDGYDEFGYPRGFRFCPKDKELVLDYLLKKINGEPLPEVDRIYEVELNKFNPEVLYEIYKKPRESKCYFFTSRKRKYRNGTRPDRAAGNGFWKPTGSDKPIVQDDVTIGYKKSLVFYNGKPPSLDGKTNWNMHEYRLNQPPREKENAQDMRLDDYVLCCIFQTSKQLNSKKRKRSVCNVEISNPNVHERELTISPAAVAADDTSESTNVAIASDDSYDDANPNLQNEQTHHHHHPSCDRYFGSSDHMLRAYSSYNIPSQWMIMSHQPPPIGFNIPSFPSPQPSAVYPPPPFGFNTPPPQPSTVYPPPPFHFNTSPPQPPAVYPRPHYSSYHTPSLPLNFIPPPPLPFPSNNFDYAHRHLESLAVIGLLDPDYDPHHPNPDHVPRNDGDNGP